ncbi:MAG TPA: hypothetical protein VKB12_06705 [Pyrinomonadaceae bacterium]|nr:hypothetical protein [Pyrinomonadaceae bacterium]
MPENLNNLLGRVSDRALKQWLKVNGYFHSADSEADLLKLLAKLVDGGVLTRERLGDAIREIEENGSKRIFLRTLIRTGTVRSRKVFEKHLNSMGLGLTEAPTVTKYEPAKPMVNYVCWEKVKESVHNWNEEGGQPEEGETERIRVKFSETHLKRELDVETGAVTTEKVTKFIIASVEPGTGFMALFFDYPEEVHPHKNRKGNSRRELYEQYYFERAIQIFNSDGLEKFDLTKASERLVETVPRIYRIPHETVRTGGNSRQRYTSIFDVRDDPARQGAEIADGINWVYEDLSGYWLPGVSRGELERELFMQLIRGQSMIRFLADCLAKEVAYAISRLRSLSATTQIRPTP